MFRPDRQLYRKTGLRHRPAVFDYIAVERDVARVFQFETVLYYPRLAGVCGVIFLPGERLEDMVVSDDNVRRH